MKNKVKIGATGEVCSTELIARGVHRRAIIRMDRFARRVERKQVSPPQKNS